jgi:hypothetical protein
LRDLGDGTRERAASNARDRDRDRAPLRDFVKQFAFELPGNIGSQAILTFAAVAGSTEDLFQKALLKQGTSEFDWFPTFFWQLTRKPLQLLNLNRTARQPVRIVSIRADARPPITENKSPRIERHGPPITITENKNPNAQNAAIPYY